MSLDYRMIAIGFPSSSGGEWNYVTTASVDFGAPVLRAETALKGFHSQFDRADHELHILKIWTSVDRIENTRVFVRVRFLLRDYSGNIDDPFSGAVQVLVLADVAPRIQPPTMLRAKAVTARKKRSRR